MSAAGLGSGALWEALDAGEIKVGQLESLDASGFPCSLGGEVKDVKARDYVPKSYRKATKVMARDTEIAVIAAQLAIADAGLASRGSGETGASATEDDAHALTPGRTGCQIGAGLLSAEVNELTAALSTSTDPDGRFDLRRWGGNSSGDGGGENAMGNLPPLWMLKYLPNMLACHVTIIHGAEGPSNTITCAESSGILCVGEASRVIERGDADVCFAGGAESKLNPLGLLRLTFAKRLATTGDAAAASGFALPYADSSTGGLPGEGGAILLVESKEHAESRGAGIYAGVAGFGAGHSGVPMFPGVFDGDQPAAHADQGLVRAIQAALDDAAITPDQIDAIVPGALGVPSADSGELNALRTVFGDRLGEIETITLAPNIGVTAAGHGALLLSVGAEAVRRQQLPARLHAGEAPEGFRIGACAARDAALHNVLVCTPSLGGQVGAIVLRRAGDHA